MCGDDAPTSGATTGPGTTRSVAEAPRGIVPSAAACVGGRGWARLLSLDGDDGLPDGRVFAFVMRRAGTGSVCEVPASAPGERSPACSRGRPGEAEHVYVGSAGDGRVSARNLWC